MPNTITHVVIPSDLGATIKSEGLATGKWDVNIDQDTIKQALGVLSVNTATGAGKSAAMEAMVKAFETSTTLAYNATTKIITHTNEKGIVSSIDLSALAIDVFVNGATYNASTMVLTLSDNSGTSPDISINLSELKRVATSNSNSVTWSGTGESSSPLVATFKVDPSVDNLITVSAAGVLVNKATLLGLATIEVVSSFGTVLGHMYP